MLLIAPTGGGKTLAGFLPSLVELAGRRGERDGIHTLYVSPLKALAVDIARNLERPVRDMALPIAVETRTGDTPPYSGARQREKPPDILITTPEQLALLIADGHAAHLFRRLRAIVLDELHALVASKRGDLAVARPVAAAAASFPRSAGSGFRPPSRDPDRLRAWLMPQDGAGPEPVRAALVLGAAGAAPEIRILKSVERVPWAGHSARYAIARDL